MHLHVPCETSMVDPDRRAHSGSGSSEAHWARFDLVAALGYDMTWAASCARSTKATLR